MAKASEIRQRLGMLLADQISLDEFEDWFVPYSLNIHLSGDDEAQKLAYEIKGYMFEYAEDSAELRAILAGILVSQGIELNYTLESEKETRTFLVEPVDPYLLVAVFETQPKAAHEHIFVCRAKPRTSKSLRFSLVA